MGKPREGKAVPADDAPCHLLDQCPGGPYWNFTSLGLRVTSMLISPWVLPLPPFVSVSVSVRYTCIIRSR